MLLKLIGRETPRKGLNAVCELALLCTGKAARYSNTVAARHCYSVLEATITQDRHASAQATILATLTLAWNFASAFL